MGSRRRRKICGGAFCRLPVSFRTPGTTTEIKGFAVSLAPTAGSASGTFAASGVPAGTYDMAIKGAKNLRVVLRNVVVSGSPSALPNVLLPAGDANGDNAESCGGAFCRLLVS